VNITADTKIALVAEELSARPDEGVLRFLERLCRHLDSRAQLCAFHTRGTAPEGIPARQLEFTRLGISSDLRRALREFAPDLILYVPSASATTNAMWRTRCLRRIGPAPVVLIGLQHRDYGVLASMAMRFLEPDLLAVTARSAASSFRQRGWKVVLARLGVDLARFCPLDPSARAQARAALDWTDDRRVILHVGHLRRNRGIDSLIDLSSDSANRVVMVASVSETAEAKLSAELAAAGVELHHEFIPDIERYYQCADAYVFPVVHSTSAIDFPLSIFEALACGLPVLTTPFGSLPDQFDGTGGLRFLGPDESFARGLDELLARQSDPRMLAEPYGWESAFEELMRNIEESLS
jgi:glycosyltransferase involved in cell wall biosynthesis